MKKKPNRGGKPSEPVQVFINAYSFRASSIALNAQPEKHLFFWPMVVNEAFALELFIKCVHRVRRRDLWGHDVQYMFGKLTKRDRKAITQRYDAIVQRHPLYDKFVDMGVALDIDSVLMRSKDAFPRVRYWHERTMPNRDAQGKVSNAGVGSLCDAIMQFLVELRPAWAQMGIRVPSRYAIDAT